MDLFGKIHVANEHMETSGREAMILSSRHSKPITDDIVVRIFHPTTGGGRNFLLKRPEVKEIYNALGTWLAEGWAGFVKGAPGPGGGAQESEYGTTQPARPIWDELERRREERIEQDRKLEDARRGAYENHTHDELVEEIRLLKFNAEEAKRREKAADGFARESERKFKAQINALRTAINGRKTVEVAEMQAALNGAAES